jgi:hypothetical protein
MTISQTTWKRTAVFMLTLALGFAPGAADAKGVIKGTFGTEKFKAKKLLVACGYLRSLGFFSISGAQGNAKKQKSASVSGLGPDPTAPGTAFPIVLTDTQASYTSGPSGPTAPTWIAGTNGVVVTLTGYKKGKVFGTVTGPLAGGYFGAVGPIEVNATFNGKCLVQ